MMETRAFDGMLFIRGFFQFCGPQRPVCVDGSRCRFPKNAISNLIPG